MKNIWRCWQILKTKNMATCCNGEVRSIQKRLAGHSTEISRGHSAKGQICVLSLLSQGVQIRTWSGCAEESGGRRLSKGAVERSVSSHLRVLRRLDPQ
jgi:hypothetical protein